MSYIDFSKDYRDYAIFTPAISEMYSRYIASKTPKRVPHFDRLELDFLDNNSKLFYLPYALYSAGQAAKSRKSSPDQKEKDQIMKRNKKTSTLIGDSGGFQIETGAITWRGDETRERMLRWLEDNCDWSMILDFPTGSITRRGDQFLKQHNVDTSIETPFNFCLRRTLENNDYFVKNRVPGATNFLNVIQGRNPAETDIWYDAVKNYPFEGWALAGCHKEDFYLTVRRLLIMRDEGRLTEKNWIHFLGMGKLRNGCIFSTIQRQLRKTVNPNITISYDVSSPFTSAAYGLLFTGYTIDSKGWRLHSKKGPDSKEFIGSDLPFPWHSPIGKLLTLGDICINDDPKYVSSWDICSYAMMMNHNTFVLLSATFEAQRLYDMGNKEFVLPELLLIKNIIEEAFSIENWSDFLKIHRRTLNELTFNKKGSGVSAVEDNSLFTI